MKRVEELRHVVSRIPVAAFFEKVPAWIDELDETCARVIQNVAAAEISMNNGGDAVAGDLANPVLNGCSTGPPPWIRPAVDDHFLRIEQGEDCSQPRPLCQPLFRFRPIKLVRPLRIDAVFHSGGKGFMYGQDLDQDLLPGWLRYFIEHQVLREGFVAVILNRV